MKTRYLLLIFVLLMFASSSLAEATDTSSDLSDAIHRLSGQEAEFTQRFLPRGYKKEHVETGRVVFGEAPASRWTYETPESKTFVFDGTTSWMYVPADESVMIHTVTPDEKAKLPFFVLSDPDKLSDRYEIERHGSRISLTAVNADTLLRSITVELSSANRLSSLEYIDGQGNRTTFELRGWKKTTTSPETFTFRAPPGVDVIDN